MYFNQTVISYHKEFYQSPSPISEGFIFFEMVVIKKILQSVIFPFIINLHSADIQIHISQ